MTAADQIRHSTDPEWVRRQFDGPSGLVSPSDEKAALEWLANGMKCWNPATKAKGATILAMLQRPVMPEEPSEEMLLAIARADTPENTEPHHSGWPARSYRALRAHLAKPQAPKTKTVFYVSWITENGSSTAGPFDGPDDASREAQNLLRADFRRVVTISPHVAEVPQ